MPKKHILTQFPSEDTLKQLAKEVASLRTRESNTLLDLVERLQKAIEAARKNHATWKDIAARLSAKLGNEIAATTLAHTYNYLKKLQKKTDGEDALSYDALKKALDLARKKIEAQDKELTECRQIIAERDEDDTAHFQIEIAALKVTLEQREHELDELRRALKESDCERLNNEIAVLKNEVELRKKEIEALRQENDALKNDLEVERIKSPV